MSDPLAAWALAVMGTLMVSLVAALVAAMWKVVDRIGGEVTILGQKIDKMSGEVHEGNVRIALLEERTKNS